MGCELCELAVPTVVDNDKFAVILVDDANYPGFARVIWMDHVREVSDLADEDRLLLNDAVYKLELAVREVMQPLKVNVASLGNVVPHLHWHVIPRYADDAHFPAPVWAQAQRTTDEAVLVARRARVPQLAEAIARRFTDR
ncbi:HIT family protein [Telluria mixta]|uniref:HIT family protein n=2 Tax=Telluria mixta TaxID=34071 RepID=A0ABT2BUY6_9BURK|nr:HIT family protein [Telluria mixta]MCS0628933.1 HIT family protein [Telluria mixta]WEM99305.1 HIT family protein [Telluria mixta]